MREKLEQGIGFKICDKKGDELLHFSGGVPGQIEWPADKAGAVRDAAERLNLIQISTEFYPSSPRNN